jgi:hypothetical protein
MGGQVGDDLVLEGKFGGGVGHGTKGLLTRPSFDYPDYFVED